MELALVRKEFVKQILEDEGKQLHDNQGKAIAKLLHFHSNRLMTERPYHVESKDSMDGQFSTQIAAYGRFLDIKPKNRGNKYTQWSQERRTKGYSIYNSIIFRQYYTIAYRLMYGLTEEVAEEIKKRFEEKS